LGEVRKARFEDVMMVSSREFYIESKGNGAIEKLLNITVKAYK